MLHASCVVTPDDRAIVMIAPHGTGKSTTALRLTEAGFQFMADGMVFVLPTPPLPEGNDGGVPLTSFAGSSRGRGVGLAAYPVGEVKLRDDVLALFPHLTGETVRVREHTKTVINLRELNPSGLVDTVLAPRSIHLCFVERSADTRTRAAPLTHSAALELLRAHTVYWDEPAALADNTALLHQLLGAASLHRLEIGAETEDLAAALRAL